VSHYARQYKGDVLFRAVVKYSFPEGGSSTYYLGPYDTHGKAQGRLTQAVGNPPRPGCEDSHVEVAYPEWKECP
jgi:hypothetical protein